MGAMTVTCGADATFATGVFSQYVDNFFRSAYTDANQAAIVGAIQAASSQTGANPLDTDDTTSYTSADQAAFGAAFPTSPPYGITNRFLRTGARQTSPAALPADAIDLAGNVVVVARTTGSQDLSISANSVDAAGVSWFNASIGPVVVPRASSFARYVLPLRTGLVTDIWVTQLAARNLRVFVTPNGGSGFNGTVEVAYMAIDLTWSLPAVPVATSPAPPAPPARLSGRMDGLGPLGGPRRLDTIGPSRQSGFHPGGYL